MYILIAVLAFGILIFTHEMGHFVAAKACGVRVLEFSMGMGPRLFGWKRGETEYSLRLLPLGGFCAMEGEDEESDDPAAFSSQKRWKKLIILVAGAAMNFLTGFLLVAVIYAGAGGFISNEIAGFQAGCPYEGSIQEGDRIWRVNGERVYFSANFSEYVTRSEQEGRVDLVLLRDGKKVRLEDYPLVPVEYTLEDGSTVMKYGLSFATEPNSFGRWLKYSWYNCLDFVRLVRIGLSDLFSGRAAVSDMAGVVGIVDIINETGQSAPTAREGITNVLYLVAFIAVNLAVMNMLPIPALDGGRVFTLLLGAVYEKIFKKKPDSRVEGWIHTVGFVLLLALMAFIMFQDIVRIIRR